MAETDLPAPLALPASKILVVEDEPEIRSVIVERLRQAGYRMLEAGDGVVALELITHEHPSLVVLDVNMPAMGGFQVVDAAAHSRC